MPIRSPAQNVVTLFFRSCGAVALLTVVSHLDGQGTFRARYDDAAPVRTKLGAVTLSADRADAFTAHSEFSRIDQSMRHSFSGATFQRQLLGSVIPEDYARPGSGRFTSLPSASTAFTPVFTESATAEEIMLAGDVTPVAEPATWLAAGLAMVFLLWKGLKKLRRSSGLGSLKRLRDLWERYKGLLLATRQPKAAGTLASFEGVPLSLDHALAHGVAD